MHVKINVVGRIVVTFALLAMLAVVAVGCGGSESAEEKWAGNVCTEVGDWEDQLKENADNVQEELQSPELGTLAAIDAQVREAVAATDKLVTDLRALEPPDTEEGAKAERELNALISQTETTVTDAKQTVATVPKGASATETAQKLAPLVPSLQALAVSVSSTLESIKAAGDKIKKGFEDADSCGRFS
jgi:hypothetical protein